MLLDRARLGGKRCATCKEVMSTRGRFPMAPVAGTPVTMPCLSKITLNVVQHLKTLTIDTGMKRPQCDALDVAYKVFTTAKMNEYENEPLKKKIIDFLKNVNIETDSRSGPHPTLYLKFTQALVIEKSLFSVAQEGQNVVGICVVSSPKATNEMQYAVDLIVVEQEENRRRGIASKMWKDILATVPRPVSFIIVAQSCLRNEASWNFWKKMDFMGNEDVLNLHVEEVQLVPQGESSDFLIPPCEKLRTDKGDDDEWQDSAINVQPQRARRKAATLAIVRANENLASEKKGERQDQKTSELASRKRKDELAAKQHSDEVQLVPQGESSDFLILCETLRTDKSVLALGERGYPEGKFVKIPDKLTLEQWTAVLDAGMVQGNNLAVIMVTGTLLDECAHDAVVGMIADRLHKSKVIALGLHGINKVEDGTWMRLKTAIKNSILGHLFVEITPEERKEFEQLLLSNRGTR